MGVHISYSRGVRKGEDALPLRDHCKKEGCGGAVTHPISMGDRGGKRFCNTHLQRAVKEHLLPHHQKTWLAKAHITARQSPTRMGT